MRGAEQVLSEFKRQLKIEVGQTTADGKFSLSSLRCVGACGLAPVVMVGEKVFGRVTSPQVLKIIEERRRKTIETFKNAEQVSHQTQNISLEYEKKIKDHKDHLRKKMDETRRELEKEQAEKLHQTKTELLKNMQEKHQKIKETVVQVEKELSQDIKGLSSEIVQKFLGVA